MRNKLTLPTALSTVAAAGVLALASCRPGQPIAHVPSPATQPLVAQRGAPAGRTFELVANPGNLHNAFVVTEKVIAGAQPEGDRSFQTLADLGVRTIISVDGARPDVERARRFGMRYVHLPIGYDGVDDLEGRTIAKALSELPGPIYVHCHHGRHRSAAALAVACVNNGTLPPHRAEEVLRTFGTGENYRGLWKSAREARPVDPAELAALQIQWVETAQVPALADAMVKLDFHFEHVKLLHKAGWNMLPHHPDLDPAHETLQVQEHLHEIGRTADTQSRPAEYRRILGQAEQSAAALRTALSADPVDTRSATAAFDRLSLSCTSCHRGFRD